MSSPVVVSDVVGICAWEFQVHPVALLGRDRSRSLCAARHLAMYVLRMLSAFSLHEIGRIFAVDHTSVIYGVGRVRRAVRSDKSYAAKVDRVLSTIECGEPGDKWPSGASEELAAVLAARLVWITPGFSTSFPQRAEPATGSGGS